MIKKSLVCDKCPIKDICIQHKLNKKCPITTKTNKEEQSWKATR